MRDLHVSHTLGCVDMFCLHKIVVYYESRKREVKIRLMNEGMSLVLIDKARAKKKDLYIKWILDRWVY